MSRIHLLAEVAWFDLLTHYLIYIYCTFQFLQFIRPHLYLNHLCVCVSYHRLSNNIYVKTVPALWYGISFMQTRWIKFVMSNQYLSVSYSWGCSDRKTMWNNSVIRLLIGECDYIIVCCIVWQRIRCNEVSSVVNVVKQFTYITITFHMHIFLTISIMYIVLIVFC